MKKKGEKGEVVVSPRHFSSVGGKKREIVMEEMKETAEFIIKKGEGEESRREYIRICTFVSRPFSFTVIDALTEIARRQWETFSPQFASRLSVQQKQGEEKRRE